MKRNEGSDRIVMGLVVVLGALVVGVIVLEIIEAISGTDTEIGPNVATLLATLGGAVAGGIAGYVTQTPAAAHTPEVPQFVGTAAVDDGDEVQVEDSSEEYAVRQESSATESYGVDEGDYDDVSSQFGVQR